jgi:hypothetical protein
MRLVSKDDAAKLAADPKAEGIKTYYVEKAKGNSIPKHFMAEENPDKKEIEIAGSKVVVGRNKERSEYVAFVLPAKAEGEEPQAYYVRDHSFLDNSTEYVEYVKPKAEPKPKKEKAAKAEGDTAAAATGAPEGTNFKGGKKGGKGKAAAATADAGTADDPGAEVA